MDVKDSSGSRWWSDGGEWERVLVGWHGEKGVLNADALADSFLASSHAATARTRAAMPMSDRECSPSTLGDELERKRPKTAEPDYGGIDVHPDADDADDGVIKGGKGQQLPSPPLVAPQKEKCLLAHSNSTAFLIHCRRALVSAVPLAALNSTVQPTQQQSVPAWTRSSPSSGVILAQELPLLTPDHSVGMPVCSLPDLLQRVIQFASAPSQTAADAAMAPGRQDLASILAPCLDDHEHLHFSAQCRRAILIWSAKSLPYPRASNKAIITQSQPSLPADETLTQVADIPSDLLQCLMQGKEEAIPKDRGDGSGRCGAEVPPPLLLPQWSLLARRRITTLSCGKTHCGVVDTRGEVWMWGNNSFGQLGNGTISCDYRPLGSGVVEALQGLHVASLACGGWHTVVIDRFGGVYSFGWNKHGQLGRITCKKERRSAEDACGEVLREEVAGLIAHYGMSHHAQPGLVYFPNSTAGSEDTDLVEIVAGSQHTVVRAASGHLYAWGSNRHGECGSHRAQALFIPHPLKHRSLDGMVVQRLKSWHSCWATVCLTFTPDNAAQTTGRDEHNPVV